MYSPIHTLNPHRSIRPVHRQSIHTRIFKQPLINIYIYLPCSIPILRLLHISAGSLRLLLHAAAHRLAEGASDATLSPMGRWLCLNLGIAIKWQLF